MSALATDLRARLEAHEPPEARGLPVATTCASGLEPPGRPHRPRPLSRPAAVPRARRSGRRQHVRDASGGAPATRADGERLELRLSTPARARIPNASGSSSSAAGTHRSEASDVDERVRAPRRRHGARSSRPTPASGCGSLVSTCRCRSSATSRSTGSRFATATSRERWPLSAYQNVYAVEPGSAEMPSAGRPFTAELITELVAGGVLVAPITLHTGVSSQERARASVPGALPRPRAHGAAGERRPRVGRPRDRRRHDSRPRARDGRAAGRHGRRGRGMDGSRRHARARSPDDRRPADAAFTSRMRRISTC